MVIIIKLYNRLIGRTNKLFIVYRKVLYVK